MASLGEALCKAWASLSARGADVTDVDDFGGTPVLPASFNGHGEIVDIS